MVSLVNSNFNSAAVLNLNEAQSRGARATANLASATKTQQGASDIGIGAVTLRTHSARIANAKLLDNLAGALGYSESQASSLKRFSDLVGEMSTVITRMQDTSRSTDDLNNDLIQFNGLRLDLVNTRRETYGDIPLYNRDGLGKDLTVSLDGGYTNTLALTQSAVVDQGGGVLFSLLGSSEQDLEILSAPVFSSDAGQEGWGTSDTNTAQALVGWGVSPLNVLLEATSRIMTVNAIQQRRLRDAIDAARTRDIDLESAESKITDEDVAQEVLTLAKASIRTQAGAAAMAQANSLADSVSQALYGGAGAGIKWHSSILH